MSKSYLARYIKARIRAKLDRVVAVEPFADRNPDDRRDAGPRPVVPEVAPNSRQDDPPKPLHIGGVDPDSDSVECAGLFESGHDGGDCQIEDEPTPPLKELLARSVVDAVDPKRERAVMRGLR